MCKGQICNQRLEEIYISACFFKSLFYILNTVFSHLKKSQEVPNPMVSIPYTQELMDNGTNSECNKMNTYKLGLLNSN